MAKISVMRNKKVKDNKVAMRIARNRDLDTYADEQVMRTHMGIEPYPPLRSCGLQRATRVRRCRPRWLTERHRTLVRIAQRYSANPRSID